MEYQQCRSNTIEVTDEVKQYVLDKKRNFRICTSCGGPILLSTSVKPPKSTDIEIYVGDYIIYVSMYQARFMDTINMDMIPQYCDFF
ncbi:hypothetical protein [Methanolacinia paynteri]|uniref:hypothetical protein n=1 Tax=Methanolacinia paynteri TaxID=230356 RepID=UPI00064FA77D|nr:hypothetical protein [Methanolacinia paynteri]